MTFVLLRWLGFLAFGLFLVVVCLSFVVVVFLWAVVVVWCRGAMSVLSPFGWWLLCALRGMVVFCFFVSVQ